ncbi:MAG: thioredoxin family protein [Deltaproteobacteria bacterium]|nr:thioredoxin family protein [Deltaproteobacteria bacterium]
MRRICLTFLIMLAISLVVLGADQGVASATDKVPVKGMVTLLDLGSHQCLPCRMMEPILEELKEEYKGRAAIVFVDVWEDRGMGVKLGIRAIPTQIFYDKQGREVFRHEGFLSKANIELVLSKLGVEKPKASKK